MRPARAFNAAKFNAKRRGISFLLTFDEWLTIWKRSGRFALRGRRKGQYCMARIADRGSYKIGNVKIILCSKNRKEHIKHNMTRAQRLAFLKQCRKGGIKNRGRQRPDLAALNRSRTGQPLNRTHRNAIAVAMFGKKRGRYKTWKGIPR